MLANLPYVLGKRALSLDFYKQISSLPGGMPRSRAGPGHLNQRALLGPEEKSDFPDFQVVERMFVFTQQWEPDLEYKRRGSVAYIPAMKARTGCCAQGTWLYVGWGWVWCLGSPGGPRRDSTPSWRPGQRMRHQKEGDKGEEECSAAAAAQAAPGNDHRRRRGWHWLLVLRPPTWRAASHVLGLRGAASP